jgi:hypothetical protein
LNYVQGPPWTHSGARPQRRGRVLWLIAAVLATAITFALGVALGQALEENPDPGPTSTTIVRTLTVPLEPAPAPGG